MNKTLKGFLIGTMSSVAVLIIVAASNGDDYERGKNLDIFFNVFRDVNLMYVDKPNSEKMVKSALTAMLKDLDPYTEYMAESEYEKFQEVTTGKYGGVGAVISKPSENEYAEVMEVVENSPTHKAGLVLGDKLVSVDNKDLKNVDNKAVSNELRGDPGTIINLKYISFLTGEEKTVKIKRDRISTPAVRYYGYVDKAAGVGFIDFSIFSENSTAEVRSAIEALRRDGELKSLILDLRSNGGGLLNEAVRMVSLFVDKGTEVVTVNGRSYDKPQVYNTMTDPIAKDIPLAILVNSSSASSSEVVAGALQDLDRATIIGTRTFGKGLVQTPKDVGHGSVLKITTAKYYTPSGRCIQAVDFSHRNEDGSVGNVPDSLKKEFLTKSGRKVYDGGGITPDIEVAPERYTRFTQNIATMGTYTENFAKEYFKAHRTAPNIKTFSLSDADLARFGESLKREKFEVLSLSIYYIQ
ncbi:MAG: S41 family peptidase [Rikenellaceae bacterium]